MSSFLLSMILGVVGWSEPAATNAPVEDEAIQVVLGMNQKSILFPCPGIFQPLLCPKIFPSYLPPPHYIPHHISRSLHLKSLIELPSLNSTNLCNTRLEEGGEFNIAGT
jgi:hypothetical protein